MKKIAFIFLLLWASPIWAKYVALLTEAASGGEINSDKDVITMKRLLGDRYEFTVLNQPEATSTNIRNTLKRLSKELTANDTFVFYYSGHGDRFYNGDAQEADHRDDFLLTSDFKCNSKTEVSNVLVDDELNYLYSKIKARKIIIIDACHSSSMDKAVIENSRSKKFKGCGDSFVTRAFQVNPKFHRAKAKNILHFGAADEKESALGSPDGGEFTLALRDVLKEKGDISFAQLEREIQYRIEKFTPSISKNSSIDKHQLRTKDIFAVARANSTRVASVQATDLQTLLEKKRKTIKVETQNKKRAYALGETIHIKGYFNKTTPQHIYLLELKGKNDFTLVAANPLCIEYSKYGYNYTCQFKDLKATKPVGTSNIYMLKTSKPLDTGSKKDSIITDEFFDAKNSLFEQLKESNFEVGQIDIKTY